MGRVDKKIKFVRWLLDFLSCLYVSWLYVVRWAAPGTKLLDTIFNWIRTTDKFLYAKFHVSVFGAIGSDPQLIYWQWLVVAILAFACIRLLGQIRLVERFIPVVGMCLTLAGPLYFNLAASAKWYMAPRVWLMRFEVITVIAILLRYAHRTSTATTALCLGTVLAHFWLWSWIMVTNKYDEYSVSRYNMLTFSVFVLLPLCTILVWGTYCRILALSRVTDRSSTA